MLRTIGVEARRMRSRRLNVVLLGTAILGITVACTVTFFKSSLDVAGATARARARAQVEYQECLLTLPTDVVNPPPGTETNGFDKPCGEVDPSQVTADPRFHMYHFLDVVKGTSAPMIVLALLLGASFIGAEWHHRTITNTLTWEPRRARLLIAKALACAGVIFVAVVGLQAFLGGALVPSAVYHGDFAGTGWAWLWTTAGAVLRSASMAAIASVIGVSIASVGRSTVAALGVAFGYFAVLEGIIRGLKPQWGRWLVGDNAAVFVSGDRLLQDGRSVLAAGLLLGIYACGAFAAAAAAFRARDVG
jgi:uncharacterized protein YjeT (DUF2065 family)